ncbi:MAG: NADH:ubiquinone oxidoreductase [Bacteroidales bacterium]
MRRVLRIIKSHGKQFVPDLRGAQVAPLFRGLPVIDREPAPEEAGRLTGLCPTGAINASPFSLDLGRCLFCRECEFACPGVVRFTNNFRIATNDRNRLVITHQGATPDIDAGVARPEVRRLFRRSLKLRQVSAAGDNSGEMELNAAGNVNFDMGRYGIEFVASPRHADGIVITGPISVNMSEALQICYDAVPAPKIIILAGTDAISGGLFEKSRVIDRSFIDRHPADLYVPGNPAHPLTFINGVMDLIRGEKWG